jgi:hypothetical protein
MPSESPEEVEAPREPVLVGVAPEDMSAIIVGLREMPIAIKQMANAVEHMAETAKKSPTKLGSAVVAVLCALVVVVPTMAVILNIQDYQRENRMLLEASYDCLYYTDDGEPAGECAQRTAASLEAFAFQLREEVRCQSEVSFFLFLSQNPELGVRPAPLSQSCLDFIRENEEG